MAADTLTRLLDDNARIALLCRGTVNHLPMALVALSRMGAPDQRLVEFFRWWESNRALPAGDGGAPIDPAHWRRHRGDRPAFGALAALFRRMMDEQGSAAVIGTVFPELSGGIAAAAFHGLIRLAYGIEADHAGEMAAGLAILCASATDFDGHIETAPPVASVEDAFSRLSDAYAGKTISGKMIVDRMRSAAGAPQFAEALSWPAIEPGRLRSELADAGLRLYWQTGDFTVLHLVTSVHALCVLFDRFPQLAALETMRAMWTAVCAAYASVGAPSLEAKALSGQTPPWTDIFQGAIASNDDHVIKMTYSCHCQQCRYGDRLYQAAAARLVAAGKA